MNKRIAIGIVVAAVTVSAAYFAMRDSDDAAIVLYGNVDIRQIELPFAESERIAEVLVKEGDAVRAGQVLARLETTRL